MFFFRNGQNETTITQTFANDTNNRQKKKQHTKELLGKLLERTNLGKVERQAPALFVATPWILLQTTDRSM